MRFFVKFIILSVSLSFIAVLNAINVSRDTIYKESDIILSKYFSLQPQEIKQWKDIKDNSSLQGFVDYKNMSIYEVLAMHTQDKNQLRKFAKLFAAHNMRVIKKLNDFDLMYQQEIKKIR